jgi:hypothetical protein
MNHQTYNLYLSISLMVVVDGIYLRFYVEVRVGTFLPTPTPPKFVQTLTHYSDSDSTALVKTSIWSVF